MCGLVVSGLIIYRDRETSNPIPNNNNKDQETKFEIFA